MTGTRLRRNLTVLLVLFGLFLLWSMAYGVFAGTADTELIARDYVDRRIGNWTVPTAWLSSIEPALIVLATPVVTFGIAALAKRGRFPGMPSQMVFGAMLSTAALIGLAFAVKAIPVNATTAPVIGLGVFTTLYAVMSIGEIFISPVYMALITRLAPRRLQGTFQGLCLLAMGLLGFASSRIGAAAETDGGANRYQDYLVTGLVAMACIVVFIPFVPWMQRSIAKWNPGHHPGGKA
jgi:POT family proton-dependent oligopeptide transporter